LRDTGVGAAEQETIVARLQAVGKSHDLLLKSDWNGAELGALAREQLAAHLKEALPRVHLQGPPAQLPPQTATAFGLLLHELATNAAKYGALSTPKGAVTLRWELLDSGAGRFVKIVWNEKGGPRVQAPSASGFGSYLIQYGLPEARVNREFRPEGVVCTIELPLPNGGSG
jgi:two-component system, chemotaxis family, CheB/CheR fusion protein